MDISKTLPIWTDNVAPSHVCIVTGQNVNVVLYLVFYSQRKHQLVSN